MKKRLLYVGALLTPWLLFAQQAQDSTRIEQLEEVIISDSRFQLKREHSGKTVIKIDQEELARSRGMSLAQVINTRSGIEINGTRSNAGQNLSAFIRGGNNRQVLVLIDGVQVTDPSTLTNNFDLRLLDLDQIAAIEIIKGAASTLYGNNAATAVISIQTKKASKKRLAASFSSTIGTNQSATDTDYNLSDVSNSIALSGTVSKFNYRAHFGHQNTDGLSAVSAGTEKDAFSRTNVGASLGYEFSDKFSLRGFANQDRFKADFDSTFPSFADADFSSLSDQYRYGLASKYNYANGSVEANLSYHRIERSFRSNFPSQFSSNSWVVDVFNKYTFNDRFYTVVGLNYIDNQVQFSQEQQTSIVDPYINLVWLSEFGLNLNVGARFNNHSEYGSHLIYNLNPSYTVKFDANYVKFLGSYSTSFIAPNLSQLFGAFGPNPELEPEENTTLEFGAELQLAKSLRLSTVYFNRTEVNFIDYVIIDFDTFEGQYQNINTDFEVSGLEVELEYRVSSKINLNANYTFTEKKDVTVFRIPKHKANASLNYSFSNRNFIGLNFQYVSERNDNDFSMFPSEISLDGFSVFDLNFGHEILKNRLSLSASITNVLNEEYTEIFGFTTRGRNLSIGFRLDF